MKKLVKILAPILMLNSLVLTGCKKTDSRVLLTFGDVHAKESRLIDMEYLGNAITGKESFLLAISTNTCGCWDAFQPSLNSYLKENKACCYRLTYDIAKENLAYLSNLKLTMISSSTTTLAIFEDGKLKTYLNSANDANIMDSKDKFAKYMSETVRLPKCFFIEKDDVTKIKSSKKNAVIYFERNACGDSTAINHGILKDYVLEHEDMNKIYVLDCQPYYRKSTDADYTDYLQVKKDLGMASETNPKYGYEGGMFPFFSFVKNGSYASGCVIYNDTVSKVDGKYKITGTYYTTARSSNLQYTKTILEGKTIPKKDVNDNEYWIEWKKESADVIYKDILKSFLDYALPKTTYKF